MTYDPSHGGRSSAPGTRGPVAVRADGLPSVRADTGRPPYYSADGITLYLGDCHEIPEWLEADVLVTDPPYGIGWRQGHLEDSTRKPRVRTNRHAGIEGDTSTDARDAVLEAWGKRPAIVFGSLSLAPPPGTRQVLVYRKAPNAGLRGATARFRRDVEAIYLIGPWPFGIGGRSSVLETRTPSAGNPSSPQGRYGHPHAKPLDVMIALLEATSGVIADPFAGSGSTLAAARYLGRRAIGVELDETYCAMAAQRCRQLPLGIEA